MRFLHVADLHIGKRVHERLMLDEQEHAFDQLISIAEDQRIDAVLVAGDVFESLVGGVGAFRAFFGIVRAAEHPRFRYSGQPR